MKKRIVNAILFLFLTLFVLNTLLAYISYVKVCEGEKPIVTFREIRKDNDIIYEQLLFRIKVSNETDKVVTSIKLFFIN